jgi:hypothetical protein
MKVLCLEHLHPHVPIAVSTLEYHIQHRSEIKAHASHRLYTTKCTDDYIATTRGHPVR